MYPVTYRQFSVSVLIVKLLVRSSVCTTEVVVIDATICTDTRPVPTPVCLRPTILLVVNIEESCRIARLEAVDLQPERYRVRLLAYETEVSSSNTEALLLKVETL